MCELDYLEPFDFYSSQNRKARKRYQCDCCSGLISKGDRYQHISYKFDGEVKSERLCKYCIKDCETFSNDHDGVYTSPAGYRELIKECINERSSFITMLKWSRILKRMGDRAETNRLRHGYITRRS